MTATTLFEPIDAPTATDPIDTRPAGNWCTATKTDGSPCRKRAMLGLTVCGTHGGRSPRAKAAGRRRLAEAAAARTLADVVVDPIANPLEKLAEVSAKVVAVSDHLANLLADEHDLAAADLLPAYERSLDRCGKFLADWVRLGFDERMVALSERHAAMVAEVVRRTLDSAELGLDDEQRRRGRELAAATLLEVSEVAA